MSSPSIWTCCRGRARRMAAQLLARRMLVMRNREPLISFTFDDFPATALQIGGRILAEHQVSGTYYTSFGLMGATAPTGSIFTESDLPLVKEFGHELGCHTFDHAPAAETPPATFERSVLDNARALERLLPGEKPFSTLSYPVGSPRPGTKKRCGRRFVGCRSGGQIFNHGSTDLNALKAFFIEQSRDDLDQMFRMIDESSTTNGWLIFATHDVCDEPTRFGCRPETFLKLVNYAARSGARILPVTEALTEIGAPASGPR